MLLFRLRINQDVIDEEDDNLVKMLLTYAVHKVHEYRRSVCQTERHVRELEMSVPRLECSFGNIFFTHSSRKKIDVKLNFARWGFPSIASIGFSRFPPESAISMANLLTIDGIKNGIYKKKENARDKKRSNNQFKNQGRNDRNKRQRTRRNFVITSSKQGKVQRQYAGQHPKCAKCNFYHFDNCPMCSECNQLGQFTRYCFGKATIERPRPTCYECGDPNHFKWNCQRMNRANTSGGNRLNPMLAIEGNLYQGNNENQAC
nr:hypothetical protein [Tanacetum cinerariifolium]